MLNDSDEGNEDFLPDTAGPKLRFFCEGVLAMR
jgi:hypothetical protein